MMSQENPVGDGPHQWQYEELVRHGCKVWVLYINNKVIGSLAFDSEENYNSWKQMTKDIPPLI